MYERDPLLIDREDERRELLGLLAAEGPSLALLTGRRRVGKTWLLTHVWPENEYFLFTASRTSPELNRRQLLTDLAGFTGRAIEPADYPTWRSVFNLLLDLRLERPLAVILDEFQYLADNAVGLAVVASELNAAWERPRPAQQFLLVLSGSAVGTMEGLNTGGAPLYGRFNWQHKLKPLDYFHSGQLAPFESLRDRAATYGIFGGIPRYLATINTADSLDQNITRLLLSPHGEVRQLQETALAQEEGLRDIASYNAILRAVATGATIRNEIAQRAGLTNDTALRDKLAKLEELGYLRRRQIIGTKASSAIRYQVNDPAMRFHQRFVQPNSSLLDRQRPDLVWQKLRGKLPVYLGHEFELLVGQAYERLQETFDLPLVREWGYWEGTDRTGKSLEVDIVAPLLEGVTLTGSIKWENKPMSASVHYQHLDMLERASAAGQAWAHSALEPTSPILYVAAGGFESGFSGLVEQAERPVRLWTLENLYTDF